MPYTYDVSAIRKTCGEDTKKIMLFGFHELINCEQNLKAALREHYTLHTYSNFHHLFPSIRYFAPNHNPKFECKAAITNLVIYNFNQFKQNLPLVPLIFIIASDQHDLELNHKQVALSSDRTSSTNITDRELRRCYRMHEESTGELRIVIEKSFHFFAIRYDLTGPLTAFTLNNIDPFWQHPEFTSHWKVRKKRSRTPNPEKTISWRNETRKAISAQHPDCGRLFTHDKPIDIAHQPEPITMTRK